MSALPSIDTIVSKVLVRPKYLNGYDLAEFMTLNAEHLRAYYDAQCALAEADEVLPSYREWCEVQFDLAVEFRARCADEERA